MTEHEEINRLQKRVDHLEAEIRNLREEAHARNIKRLQWGVSALGSVLMFIGLWAWSQVQDLIQLNLGQK